MKRILPLLMIALLSVSCNWDFLNPQPSATPATGDVTTYKYYDIVATENGAATVVGTRTETSVNGALKNVDDKYYNRDGQGNFVSLAQLQHYSAGGTLLYIVTYAYDADGNVQVAATYDSDKVVDSFLVYSWEQVGTDWLKVRTLDCAADGSLKGAVVWDYDSAGNRTLEAAYNADTSLAEASTWEYDAATADARLLTARTFDGRGNETARVVTTWDANGREAQRTWYGAAASASRAGSVGGASLVPAKADMAGSRQADDPDRQNVDSRLETGLPGYTVPESVVLPDPVLANQSLAEVQHQFWRYDDYGSMWAILDQDWYPVELERTDSRLAALLGLEAVDYDITVHVAVGWQDMPAIEIPAELAAEIPVNIEFDKRPVSKVTTINGVEALNVTVHYASSTGLPDFVSTSGAAMTVPLDFSLEYNDFWVPTKLTVLSSDATIMTFTYDYGSDAGVSQPAKDPMAMLAFARNVHVIRNYVGVEAAENLLQTFTFTYSNEGDNYQERVDVTDAAGASTGYFLVSFDANGLVGSIASHDATSALQWSYSYSYDQLKADLPMYQRMAEDFIADTGFLTGEETDYLASYASNFVYQLLFN